MSQRARSESGRGTLFLLALFVGVPVAIGLVTAIVAMFLMPLHACENEIVRQIPAPDGRHRAVVFRRHCGATTGDSTQVSVVRSDAPLADRSGNLLVLDGEQDIEATWQGPLHLEVRYPRGPEVFYASGEAEGVTATLEGHALAP